MAPENPLISCSELADLLDSARPVTVADVRFELGGPPGYESYLAGHVPGARYVDLDADLAGEPGTGGRHPLPEPAVFAAALRRIGVHPDVPVVCCDGRGATAAARLWWMLTDAGHQRVSVVDGGFAAWQAAGGEVSTRDEPAPGDGTFRPEPGHNRRLDAATVARLPSSGVLLDARAAERYRGEHEPVDPRAGHIPGAVNAPTTDNLLPDGRFASPEALLERFARLGLTPDREVGAYCGSGVTAAHEILALRVAGFPGAALYPGSWSEWVADPDRPVATGPNP